MMTQDGAADAMADVYERWAHVRNPSAYARTAALNAATNQARRERERLTRSIRGGWITPELVDPYVSVDDSLDRGAGRQLLQSVRLLPYHQRVVLAWHLDGFKNTEIAEHEGMNPATVGSHLRHAKQRLRAILQMRDAAEADDERRDPG